MTHVLALETPDGAIAVFTSPIPGNLLPTLNGRTRTGDDYVVLSSTQVRFVDVPRMGDVVGFFVQAP